MILLISPGGTGGWRANEAALAASLERLGYEHEVRRVPPGRLARLTRFWAIGSFAVAWRARRALERELGGRVPEAVIAVNSTSAMLLPWRRLDRLGIPVAIRIDCPAGAQFPGLLHLPHRLFERRALGRAELALTMGPRSSDATRALARRVAEVPFGVAPPSAPAEREGVTALAYAGQPRFKGLDVIARAWAGLGATRGSAVLNVTGIEEAAGRAYLRLHGIPEPEGWNWAGNLPRADYEALLAGASVFVSASRLEGHGIAQLEALAAGVPLATTPSEGAYEAEPIARDLAPQICTGSHDPDELAGAITRALALSPDDRAVYASCTSKVLGPYVADAVDPALAEALSSLGLAPGAPVRPVASPKPQSAG